ISQCAKNLAGALDLEIGLVYSSPMLTNIVDKLGNWLRGKLWGRCGPFREPGGEAAWEVWTVAFGGV
ncbi:MAG TPA: hypothetical protein VK359_03385, partial [Rubrobacteraceae bacterium]|nr:hypothetical protein [Rubrobacteraceae bacterium]